MGPGIHFNPAAQKGEGLKRDPNTEQIMKITIFGSGYVGLVTGACLADVGNDILCVDVDAAKVERLRAGEIPIHEPGLEAVIARNVRAGRLFFPQ